MWIFLAKIHAEITTPAYTIWENAIAFVVPTSKNRDVGHPASGLVL